MDATPPYPWQAAGPPGGVDDSLATGTTTKENDDNNLTRGQAEWSRKCASQFSLYADLVGDTGVSDPFDQLEAVRAGYFVKKARKDKKPSKSSKKRLKRIFKTKSAQKKRQKKDLKRVIDKLSKMPL